MKKAITTVVVFILCFACFASGKITAPLSLSWLERSETNKVESLGKVWLQHEKNYYLLFFALLDKNKKELKVPVYVDVRIVNSNGEEVYNETKIVKSSDYRVWSSLYMGDMTLASIVIRDDEIKPASSEEGTLYFKVYNPTYVEFDEMDMEISSILYGGLPFGADYSNPIVVDPYELDADFDNPLKVKKLYAGKPIQVTVKISSINSSYNGHYSIFASDHRSGDGYSTSSYLLSIYIEDSELDKLAEYSRDQSITVCGFLNTNTYSLELVHAIIIK